MSELLGTWRLQKWPRTVGTATSIQVNGKGSFILETNKIDLQEVLLEEATFPVGMPPNIQWRSRTGSGTWQIFKHANNETLPPIVRITLDGDKEVDLDINHDSHGRLVLIYQPDPEMAVPFIFVQDGAANRD